MAVDQNVVKAYEAIIDFNKVIISICSSILAALIAYLAFQGAEYEMQSFLCLAVLVLSIIASVTSFGRAIETLKDGISKPQTILLANVGAGLLIVGVFTVFLVKPKDDKSIDAVLISIGNATKSMKNKLSPEKCIRIELKEGYYFMAYKVDSTEKEVIYSLAQRKITAVH